jgi:hypothetical protein
VRREQVPEPQKQGHCVDFGGVCRGSGILLILWKTSNAVDWLKWRILADSRIETHGFHVDIHKFQSLVLEQCCTCTSLLPRTRPNHEGSAIRATEYSTEEATMAVPLSWRTWKNGLSVLKLILQVRVLELRTGGSSSKVFRPIARIDFHTVCCAWAFDSTSFSLPSHLSVLPAGTGTVRLGNLCDTLRHLQVYVQAQVAITGITVPGAESSTKHMVMQYHGLRLWCLYLVLKELPEAPRRGDVLPYPFK